MRESGTTRTPQSSVSAALAAVNAAGLHPDGLSVRFPGDDGGHSLAEMAERDLDAALQLLADRAQYITGAGGAAIALRRNGKNDLLCRASAGSNAPELGALLSTEFGLSGESVRTKRALRCDDAERDARVNRDVCRELGIASVVVMPVVNDDQVLGVFELFSGKANAFGDRDLSALQRLSEMVETAVRLARATESTVGGLDAEKASAVEVPSIESVAGVEAEGVEAEGVEAEGVEAEEVVAAQEHVVEVELEADPAAAPESVAEPIAMAASAPSILLTTAPQPAEQAKTARAAAAAKPLFWSVALSASGEAEASHHQHQHQEDQSHVPPMLRNLRKCDACGFPVSAGRALCVECEEKKWRGQLKMPRPGAPGKPASPQVETRSEAARVASAPVAVPAVAVPVVVPGNARGNGAKAVAELAAQAAPSFTPVASAPSSVTPSAVVASKTAANAGKAETAPKVALEAAIHPSAPLASSASAAAKPAPVASPDFVLSAGLEPSQSWFARNKYVIAVILVAGAALAGFVLLR